MGTPKSGLPALTAANLQTLQPTFIQPMAPISISSSSKKSAAAAVHESLTERLDRLKAWVYNALKTLQGLGEEGRWVLARDDLQIVGPGDMRFRDDDVGLKYQNDLGFWEAKLQYLQEQCQPLSQARRKRRRLNPELAAEEEAAQAQAEQEYAQRAHLAAYPGLTPEELAEERSEQARIEESRLLWQNKRRSIETWLGKLPEIPRAVLLVNVNLRNRPNTQPSQQQKPPPAPPPAPAPAPVPAPTPAPALAATDDSSVVEITPVQFTKTTPDDKPIITPPQREKSTRADPPPIRQEPTPGSTPGTGRQFDAGQDADAASMTIQSEQQMQVKRDLTTRTQMTPFTQQSSMLAGDGGAGTGKELDFGAARMTPNTSTSSQQMTRVGETGTVLGKRPRLVAAQEDARA